ncbi:Gfo/Idh/MocA family oxidoreductase [Pelomonas sp. P7]|uniref:Gfo/Idh/MocA family oxidoreductase n=1 Tax=Pelomonas caseinilytica TaxID=2906763 RepID=A0ABS8XB34_9BURK|nr:Gfo/Idh/MocA family oxidoreductase [Pelomonas sp. P7]MCE4538157.1 Gfo/Idh/MocA family oxidoreductase [Pelomonas sp. P7]
MSAGLRKFVRFIAIYGLGRSLFKAAGRLRIGLPTFALRRPAPDIGLIGCGQFAFATIGYFIHSTFGSRILACYDVDPRAQQSLARAQRVRSTPASINELLTDPRLRTIYIASNHASHADYAVLALQAGLQVYVEKPIAVTEEQLVRLLRACRGAEGRIFAGYNRPFSSAVRHLRSVMPVDSNGGFTLSCFISGHQLGAEHWYRRPEEGTRICGNVGHWLDLMVHVLSWRGMPDRMDVSLSWADADEPDDNVSITITSDRGDLFTVTLTSRCEPFEGINETINLQHGETIAKIDDFRHLTIWRGSHVQRKRFWPKDVGHRLAILQPFQRQAARAWEEVVLSTLLMLRITDMVRARERLATFSFSEARARIQRQIEAAK